MRMHLLSGFIGLRCLYTYFHLSMINEVVFFYFVHTSPDLNHLFSTILSFVVD